MKTGEIIRETKTVWMLWTKESGEMLGPFPTRKEAREHKLSTDRLLRADVSTWTVAK